MIRRTIIETCVKNYNKYQIFDRIIRFMNSEGSSNYDQSVSSVSDITN